MTWRGTTTAQDRFFACLPYLLPLIEVLAFGSSLFNQFPPLRAIFRPLSPLIAIYYSNSFMGLIIFFVLFLLVVRNTNISHFIRFNTMQAILLDIVVFLGSLLLQISGALISSLPSGLFAMQTLSSTLFLGIVVAVLYSVIQSLLGRYAEIPAISDAVHMQVR